jgi:hypothetical protein
MTDQAPEKTRGLVLISSNLLSLPAFWILYTTINRSNCGSGG